MFLFQSCYEVGYPVAATSISGVELQAYMVQGMFVSWHEQVDIKRVCFVCVHVEYLTNNFI
jgi:hypothetical protein